MDSGQTSNLASIFEFIEHIESQHGLPNAFLVVLFAATLYAFHRMVWWVWKDATRLRDREIARLEKEREVYQALIFQRLKSSDNAGATNRNISTDGED